MTLLRVVAVALPFLIMNDSRRPTPPAPAPIRISAVASLGKKIFFDPSLSASGTMSCATCHAPAQAYGPPNDLAVERRAVPSLRYLEHTPLFSIGPTDATVDSDDVLLNPIAPNPNATPQGGLTWDGRADTFQDQAKLPFLDPHEMANRSVEELLSKLKQTPYAEDFRRLFGPLIFEQPDLALNEALFALTRFQVEDPSFHPYNSRYDNYLAGKISLTPQEQRGLKLFEDPKKGNCSSCHISRPSPDGKFPPAFTDYEFEALGVPRNMEIPANKDPRYFDLGLCGPLRQDFAQTSAYCGLFKTPTLRNVAVRRVFFHNGVFHSLEDAVRFYVERETKPEADKYNDLPPRYRANVDIVDAPFDRKKGDPPALNAAEITDVVAFLKTLTDRDLLK